MFFMKLGKFPRASPTFRSVDVEDPQGKAFPTDVKKGCHLP